MSNLFKLEDGSEVELEHEMDTYRDHHVFEKGNYLVVAYLARDNDTEHLLDDLGGHFYTTSHNRDGGEGEVRRALGFGDYWDKNIDKVDDKLVLKIMRDSVKAAFDSREQNGLYMDAFDLAMPLDSQSDPFTESALERVLSSLETVEEMEEFAEATDNEDKLEKLREEAWLVMRKSGAIGDLYAIGLDHNDYRYYINKSINSAIPEDKVDGAWIADEDAKESINWNVANRLGFEFKYVKSQSGDQYSDVQVTDPNGVSAVFNDLSEAWNSTLKIIEGCPDYADIVRDECRKFAEGVLKDYNQIAQGDVYGICVEHYIRESEDDDSEWIRVGEEVEWGCVGDESAEEELKASFNHDVANCSDENYIAEKRKEYFGEARSQQAL